MIYPKLSKNIINTLFTFYVKYSEEVCHCDSGLAPDHFVFLYKTFTNVGFLIKPHLWWVPKILKSLRNIFYIGYFGKTLLMSWASWARLMNPEGKSTLKRQQWQSLKRYKSQNANTNTNTNKNTSTSTNTNTI